MLEACDTRADRKELSGRLAIVLSSFGRCCLKPVASCSEVSIAAESCIRSHTTLGTSVSSFFDSLDAVITKTRPAVWTLVQRLALLAALRTFAHYGPPAKGISLAEYRGD
jgi:hypothetical protein